MKVYIIEYVDYEQTHIDAVFDSYEKAVAYVNNCGKYDIYEWELNTTNGSIV